MTKLTTHVLDTASGVPAKQMIIRLSKIDADNGRQLLVDTKTNDDGRCDAPLLEGVTMLAGSYELEFEAGAYFSSEAGGKSSATENPFLDCIVIRFGISDPTAHYHVPLLVSPFSYSTYRGS